MKCKDLMYGDWCRDGHGFPMQITNVGDDYAYATFEGLEGDPWEFDDKDCKPSPIEIIPELFKANGWKRESYMAFHWDGFVRTYYFVKDEGNTHIEFKCNTLTIWFDYKENNDGVYADILVPCKYENGEAVEGYLPNMPTHFMLIPKTPDGFTWLYNIEKR